MFEYKGIIKRVVDADTLDISIDLGFKVWINARVRLAEINAPEIYGVLHESEEYKKGMEAKKFVENWAASYNNEVTIVTRKNKTGKYGRWIAKVYSPEQVESLNALLVENNYATWESYE